MYRILYAVYVACPRGEPPTRARRTPTVRCLGQKRERSPSSAELRVWRDAADALARRRPPPHRPCTLHGTCTPGPWWPNYGIHDVYSPSWRTKKLQLGFASSANNK